jgi:hypothetical protein
MHEPVTDACGGRSWFCLQSCWPAERVPPIRVFYCYGMAHIGCVDYNTRKKMLD